MSTAVDVVRYAEKHLDNFGLSYLKLNCVVIDTESTMITAGQLFKHKSIQSGGTSAWHGCIGHVLELITKLTFKEVPGSIGAKAACRAIVTFLNSFSQATANLKEKTKPR